MSRGKPKGRPGEAALRDESPGEDFGMPSVPQPTVNYHALTPAARRYIRDSGLSIAGYVRHWCPGGRWLGDRCGCTDDRCIGYHHDEHEECGCLPVLVELVRAEGVTE